jgi:hypothetical protein
MADIDAPMPVTVLLAGYQVVIEAVDAATGSPVTGVVLNDVTISGANLGGSSSDTAPVPLPNVEGAYLPSADAGNQA